MMNTQNPIINRIGTQVDRSAVHGLAVGSRAVTTTLRSSNRFARPSVLRGRDGAEGVVGLRGPGDFVARNGDLRDLAGIHRRHELAEGQRFGARLELGGKIHDMTAMTAIAIQNTKLRIVELKSALPSDFPTA